MFGIGGFNRKPRQFTYTPRSYDPEKEAREQRRRQLLAEGTIKEDDGTYVPGSYIRSQRMGRRMRGEREERHKRNTIRVIIAVVLMAAAAYYLFIS